MNWIDALSQLHRNNEAYVLVTVLEVHGSTPRGPQTKMVITKDQIFDSVGGGNLEFQAMERARKLLSEERSVLETAEFTLGQDLTQCCGGRVKLLFECFIDSGFQVVLCGAGHVGKALAKILAELPCHVRWLDARTELLSEAYREANAPSNITPVVIENPYLAVEKCPASALYLIMTHSHETDFEFCEAILGRDDLLFCGLIGSKSKAIKFRKRLLQKKFSEAELSRLTTPIGIEIGAGKRPMEIAVAVAAQLMQIYNGAAGNFAEEPRGRLEIVSTAEKHR